MSRARARRRRRVTARADINEETYSVARFALGLEVEWLREKGWTDNEIRGLWSRLNTEYEHTSARVKGRQRRSR
jgi:hypothetical protein